VLGRALAAHAQPGERTVAYGHACDGTTTLRNKSIVLLLNNSRRAGLAEAGGCQLRHPALS
jgi:hypothetical protein